MLDVLYQIPAGLLEARVIRQNCFCHLMERYNDHVPIGEPAHVE